MSISRSVLAKCERLTNTTAGEIAIDWLAEEGSAPAGGDIQPNWTPIVLARKPLIGTVAANVQAHGTGAINVDGCRVATDETIKATRNVALGSSDGGIYGTADKPGVYEQKDGGRWPANIIHDGSEEVIAAFPRSESQASVVTSQPGSVYGNGAGLPSHTGKYGFNDSGSAARFFYAAKADAGDRLQSKHPTVKPVDLMAYLCRLITPPGGLVLDPFAGTGTTGAACIRESFDCILIEREAEYVADIRRRLAHVRGEDAPLFASAP